jgi:aldehyde dehydrogenase (NAD+)
MEYGPAAEDAAAARQWISDQDSLFGHWINGEWTEAAFHFDSVNPATGDVLARVSRAGSKEIDAAVAAARQALGPWQALSTKACSDAFRH